MQIIIVGCGKVGRTLAEQLQEEESDITLIDVSSNVINQCAQKRPRLIPLTKQNGGHGATVLYGNKLSSG